MQKLLVKLIYFLLKFVKRDITSFEQFALKHSGQKLSDIKPVELPTLVGAVKQEAYLSPFGVDR
jgi:hypothetical protein